MLAHSPPLPLTIDYRSDYRITGEDEDVLLLILEQRHRVRHLRLGLPVQNLRKLVMAIDEEFPIFEYLIVVPQTTDSAALMLPETLQAPNLHYLRLTSFAFPIRSRLLPAVQVFTHANTLISAIHCHGDGLTTYPFFVFRNLWGDYCYR
jgi:hypothetical protein